MLVLFLGPYNERITNHIKSFGDEVLNTENGISEIKAIGLENIDYIISFGYRYIIPKEIIEKYNKRIINLHISLLPWNRGADPNLWSFLEDTPKGVTIHYIDEGIDTGEIIAQKEVKFPDINLTTLRNSYETLKIEIVNLFIKVWIDLKAGKINSKPQNHGGSFHCLKDKRKYDYLLEYGWDTPVAELIGKAKEKIYERN